jgi:hypothetical protein
MVVPEGTAEHGLEANDRSAYFSAGGISLELEIPVVGG